MLDYNTAAKLREMRLSVMGSAFANQIENKDMSALSFEERVGLMVDAEYTARVNNKLKRLMRKANFAAPEACLEDIEYHPDRELDRTQIARLAACGFIAESQNIIILGASGGGKTYISNAFGTAAVRKFIPVKYIRLPELLGELAIARLEGNYRKVVKTYKTVSLLIIDEWLLTEVKPDDAKELLEIAEARYKKASTIFCSQFDVGGWHSQLGGGPIADAICDRIVHDSHRIVIARDRDDAVSMRARKGLAATVG
jgi:DNA replication protein DnaC